jgi:hypothetical protein
MGDVDRARATLTEIRKLDLDDQGSTASRTARARSVTATSIAASPIWP